MTNQWRASLDHSTPPWEQTPKWWHTKEDLQFKIITKIRWPSSTLLNNFQLFSKLRSSIHQDNQGSNRIHSHQIVASPEQEWAQQEEGNSLLMGVKAALAQEGQELGLEVDSLKSQQSFTQLVLLKREMMILQNAQTSSLQLEMYLLSLKWREWLKMLPSNKNLKDKWSWEQRLKECSSRRSCSKGSRTPRLTQESRTNSLFINKF